MATFLGTPGADTLTGGTDNDLFIVNDPGDVVIEQPGEGTDTIEASVDVLSLSANVEDLTLTGTATHGTGNILNNLITGNSISSTLNGAAGDDTIIGGAGNDSLDGGTGNDSLSGGDGNDIYVVDSTSDKITESATGGTEDTVQASFSFVLGANLENLTLTGTEDINGTGNSLANSLTGNSGANILDGGAGNDSYAGGAGNDTYILDNLDEGFNVTEAMNEGTDTIQLKVSGAGDFTLGANIENVTIIGTGAINLAGNVLSNVLTGNAAANVITGGDTTGGAVGNDTLLGLAGNDTLIGLDGNDSLNGGAGADSMTGGAGNDIYVVDNIGDQVVEANDTVGGIDTVQASINFSIASLANVENITLTGTTALNATGNTADNNLTGNSGNNLLDGGAGNDTILGNAGNDTLIGGAGDDSLNGGSGNDIYVINSATDYTSGDIIFDSGATSESDEIRFAATTGTLILNSATFGIEKIVIGTGTGATAVTTGAQAINVDASAITNNLTITGNAGANSLTGGSGNDNLNGGAGNDTLSGGAGNDTLDGGVGVDSYAGGTGNDTYQADSITEATNISEGISAGTDSVLLNVATGGIYTVAANVENVALTGVGNVTLIGNSSDNSFIGNAANNSMDGGAGNDFLISLAGNDTLIGGTGNDSLDGGTGADSMTGGDGDDVYAVDNISDKIFEDSTAGSGTDTVDSTINYVLGANLENLTLLEVATAINGTGNSLDNMIIGNSRNNNLSGSDGNDTLLGGAGNDTLVGGLGGDSLNGGTGNDLYIVNSSTEYSGDSLLDTDGTNDELRFTTTTADTLTLSANTVGIDLVTIGTGTGVNAVSTGTANINVDASALTSGIVLVGNAGNNVLSGSSASDIIEGGIGNDSLVGGAGNDSLVGGAGNDTLAGGAGNDTYVIDINDTIDEGSNTDTGDTIQANFNLDLNNYAGIENGFLSGTASVNVIGNASNNTLIGNAGNNHLSGGAGNDLIYGAGGSDTLSGGLGNDIYLVDRPSVKVVEDLAQGTDKVLTTLFSYNMGDNLENLSYISFQNINQEGNANFLGNGNALNNTIVAGSGNDTLNGGAGNDNLDGGSSTFNIPSTRNHSGNDSLNGGEGDDTLQGQEGNDTLVGGMGSDALVGGADNDLYLINSFAEYTTGDVISDSSGTDELRFTGTTAGTLTLNLFTLGIEKITIGTGVGANAVITGTAAINIDASAILNSVSIVGNAGNNSLTGGASSDTLIGNAGDDTLAGGGGNDSLVGGSGNDTYVIDTGDIVIEAANGGTDTLQTNSITGLDLGNYNNVENLIYTGSADFTGIGSALNNIITGGSGNDSLSGGLGNDTLIGGAGDDSLDGGLGNDVLNGGSGNDTLDGGTGNDVYLIAAATDHVVAEISDSSGTADEIRFTSTSGDTLVLSPNDTGIEKITISTETGLTTGTSNEGIDASGITDTNKLIITGNNGNNSLIGGAGNDSIVGNGGNDTLDGGAGNDTLAGGVGNDTYMILQGSSDLVVESANAGTDSIVTDITNFFLTTTPFANIENLTYTGGSAFNATGNALNNAITGGSGNDSLTGLAGNDTLDGGAGDDSMDGGTGNDTYIVDSSSDSVNEALNAGIDTVIASSNSYTLAANIENLTHIGSSDFTGTGNELNNVITGSSGNDSLTGGSGNDTLDGNGGNDTLDGGDGNDVYLIASAADHTQAISDSGGTTDEIRFTSTGNDTLTLHAGDVGIEKITIATAAGLTTGTNDASIDASGILGTAKLIITGNNGNNSIVGGNGGDSIVANAGNDTLDGGAGNDTMLGGVGNDTYVVDSAADVVTEAANAGTDTVETTLGIYTLSANVENLTHLGGGDFTGTGNALNNVLTGGSGNDTLIGGAGNDTYIVNDAADIITETATGGTSDTVQTSSLDSIDLSSDYANVENLTYTGSGDFTGTGNELNNVITGGSGNDTLIGNAGNDTLIGGAGDDSLDGGAGNDIYIIGAAADHSASEVINDTTTGGVQSDEVRFTSTGTDTLTLRAGDVGLEKITIATAAGLTTGTNDANIDASGILGTAKLIITGNNGNNSIVGGNGGDSIVANAGNDTLDGGAGNDTMLGGAGNDTYVVDSATDVVTEATNAGTDTVETTLGIYTLSANVENLTYTGSGDFTGTGNALNNILTGGDGNDTLAGGAGNDTYIVNNAADVITETATGGTSDTVQTDSLSSLDLSNYANVENLTYTGSSDFIGTGSAGNNVLTGGSGNDTLLGNAGNDTLIGGAGDDRLNGGAGNDSMTGGIGNDTYTVDSASDIVTEAINEGTDTIQTNLASLNLNTYANIENLTYTGSANFLGTGNSLDNSITGNTGNDTLLGNAGNDTLNGGAGNDTMDGGAGNDIYLIAAATEHAQYEIQDFSGTADEIRFTSTGTDTLVLFAGDTGIEKITIGTATGDTSGTNNANIDASALTNSLAITGNGGDNSLTGGSGSDTIDGGAGNDTMIGGAGSDTYIVDSVGDSITEGTNSGTDLIKTSLTSLDLSQANYTNVENLLYTGTSDFTGSGNSLNNSITGGTGNDSLSGGAGNDTLDGGLGDDTLVGGADNDTYIVDSVGDVVTEGASAGTDIIKTSLISLDLGNYNNIENLTYTGSADFTGIGSSLDNAITGGIGNDSLAGNAGNDTLDGGAGNDTLVGGAGNDVYVVDSASDVVTELSNDGTDAIQTSLGSFDLNSYANVENLIHTGSSNFIGTGTALDNAITGGSGNDTLNGGAGNDTLDGGSGNDVLFGGADNDTYVVDSVNDVVTELSNEGTDTIQTALASLDLHAYSNIENLVHTGSVNFTGTGNGQDNSITGGTGSDTLNGGGGNDTLVGGAGNDTYIIDSLSDVITEASNEGTDTIQTSLTVINLNAYTEIENIFHTGSSDFIGTGTAANNSLTGGSGNDSLSGLGGNDTLDGGAGNDTLVGGSGNDTYIVDSTSDVVDEAGNTDTADTIRTGLTSLDLNSYSNIENLVHTGATNFTGTGTSSDNSITGGSGNDTLNGDTGNDTLDGGTGNDVLIGGTGNDVYIVDNVSDVVTEASNEGTDTILTSLTSLDLNAFSNIENLTHTSSTNFIGTGNSADNSIAGNSGNDTLNGGAGNDNLSGGGGNDVLNGGSGNDSLNGSSGNDVLTGSAGSDTLAGGSGNDLLTGGADNDVFVFDTALGSTNIDTISDFNSSSEHDILSLSHSIFSNLAIGDLTTTGNAFDTGSGAGAVATTTDPTIIYDTTSGALYYDADGTGSAAAVQFATLTGAPALTAIDIHIV
ncbi:MAG TPA: hypothetical protein VIE91_00130 [Methylophilaceae bacterium]|jgi:Ca2+-binding RTX toxin-like protein